MGRNIPIFVRPKTPLSMILTTILTAAMLATASPRPQQTPPQADSVIVDSQQTFDQAIEGTPAPQNIIRNLRIVDVEYYSFDSLLHRGQIVVHKDLVRDVQAIFKELKRIKFPVYSVIPIPFDRPENGTSFDTLGNNNSYGFHYRPIATYNTTKLSNHSYGRAVDINPLQNPAILRSGHIIPEGACYDPDAVGTITPAGKVAALFRRYGWTWGGNWRSLKDYMHFEKMP